MRLRVLLGIVFLCVVCGCVAQRPGGASAAGNVARQCDRARCCGDPQGVAKSTEEIERIEGKLKLLRDRIAWSTITVTFEKLQQQKVRQQALLPFPWMNVIGLSPLLSVPR